MSFYITYNNSTGPSGVQFKVARRPSVPSAAWKYKSFTVPGRDGDLYIFDDTVEDVVIPIEFSIISGTDNFESYFATVKDWLYSKGNQRLILSDYSTYFYKVKKVAVENIERLTRTGGTFTAMFTVEGYRYKIYNYDNPYPTTAYCLNPEESTCHPLYEITGTGLYKIKIGSGDEFKINLPDNATAVIDTDLFLAYRKDTGASLATSCTGDYTSLWIPPGSSTITKTGSGSFQFYARIRERI